MVTCISSSPSETETLGQEWGHQARAGWVFALTGDLGTGKTQLARGLARGLGFMGRVQSPSFALINAYEGGRMPVYHLDLYRLETPAQVIGAGLEQFLQPDGVSVIEWAERWFGPWNQAWQSAVPLRRVRLTSSGETLRVIEYEDIGV